MSQGSRLQDVLPDRQSETLTDSLPSDSAGNDFENI